MIVDRGMNAFRTKGPGATRTVTNSTIVSLDIFDDAGNATFGCFVINPADFTVSRDLQTASLHTTLTADEICPGFGSPVTAGAASPFAGAGGGGAGLPLPITLDIVWNGLGVTSTGADHSTSRCLDYSTDFNSAIRSSNAGAAGTISSDQRVLRDPDGRRQLFRRHRHHQGHPAERLHPAVGRFDLDDERRGTGRAVRFSA